MSTEAVVALEQQIRAVKDTERAFAIASQDSGLLNQEPLSGVGGNEWKLLYEAAQKYSTDVAYVGKEFPYVGDDSLCVLCMQHLSEEAKARFRRFKSSMEQAVRRQRDKATTELLVALKELCELDLDVLSTHKDAFDEIQVRDRACADATRTRAGARTGPCRPGPCGPGSTARSASAGLRRGTARPAACRLAHSRRRPEFARDHREEPDPSQPLDGFSPQPTIPVAVISCNGSRRAIRGPVPFRAREIKPSEPEVAVVRPARVPGVRLSS